MFQSIAIRMNTFTVFHSSKGDSPSSKRPRSVFRRRDDNKQRNCDVESG